MPCVEVFVQDPELYLESVDTTLPCPVRRDRDAVLNAELRTFVNHEPFFFSTREALDDFLRRPLRYIDRITDPVNLVRFTPTEASPFVEHDGRPFYFASLENLEAFQAEPQRYAYAVGRMR